MPEVTIIIPTRDRWSKLSSCGLRSALCQIDVDLEVVVVDDGSSDETTQRLHDLGHAHVRVVRHDEPRGVAAARNAGIAVARGGWIAFLDDDDLWSPLKLRNQLDRAAATNTQLIYTGVIEIDENGNPLQTIVPETTTLEALLEWNTIPAGSSNVIARSEQLRAVAGFDERLKYVADWDLWIRLAACSDLAVVPQVLVGYVRHGSGMGFAGRNAVDEMQYFVRKHRQRGLRVDPAAVLWWVAADNRLDGRRRAAASTYFRTALAYRRPRRVLRAVSSLLEPRSRRTLRARAARSHPRNFSHEVSWLTDYQ